jgi:hypothetical protein
MKKRQSGGREGPLASRLCKPVPTRRKSASNVSEIFLFPLSVNLSLACRADERERMKIKKKEARRPPNVVSGVAHGNRGVDNCCGIF